MLSIPIYTLPPRGLYNSNVFGVFFCFFFNLRVNSVPTFATTLCMRVNVWICPVREDGGQEKRTPQSNEFYDDHTGAARFSGKCMRILKFNCCLCDLYRRWCGSHRVRSLIVRGCSVWSRCIYSTCRCVCSRLICCSSSSERRPRRKKIIQKVRSNLRFHSFACLWFGVKLEKVCSCDPCFWCHTRSCNGFSSAPFVEFIGPHWCSSHLLCLISWMHNMISKKADGLE